jgi:exodeoxyribonuclease III
MKKQRQKIVSWNLNGIRSAMDKGFRTYIETEIPDIVCLQETKATNDQVDLAWADDLNYQRIWNGANKKGYSGTCVWSRIPWKSSHLGIGLSEHDQEGRVITVTFDDFHLVNVYTPNSQRGLVRLDYRLQWDADFRAYLLKLNQIKPVIFCGDLNCAHHEIDLANPKANRRNAGFSDEERAGLDQFVAAKFVDTFRYFCSDANQYTWWTYRMNARERNIGWRLDYFWADERLVSKLIEAKIRADIHGSDHCPVELVVECSNTTKTLA